MNTFIQLAMLGMVSLFSVSTASLTGTYLGCKQPNLSAAISNYKVSAFHYPDSKHVRWDLRIILPQATNNASVTVCFDAPQCVTDAYFSEKYPDTGAGVHCTTIVDMNMASRSAGESLNLIFHTYSATPVMISSLTLNGNGIVQKSQLPRASPSVANDFCVSCDGGYAGDISNCGSFYHCSAGQAYSTPCPGGLYFNAALGVCDKKENAGCGLVSSQMNGIRHVQCRSANSDCTNGLSLYSDTVLISSCKL